MNVIDVKKDLCGIENLMPVLPALKSIHLNQENVQNVQELYPAMMLRKSIIYARNVQMDGSRWLIRQIAWSH
jgi:hypothetical protein